MGGYSAASKPCAPRGRAVARVLLLHPFSRLASVKPAPDSHVRRMLLQLVAIAYFGLCIYLLVVRSDFGPNKADMQRSLWWRAMFQTCDWISVILCVLLAVVPCIGMKIPGIGYVPP